MPRDANATRARIFSAASDEFAQYGIAGARVDRIADTAKANKARIYEYFGKKEELFETVLEEELHRLTLELPPPTEPKDVIDFVTKAFEYHQNHPNLLRLLHWEALHYGTGTVPGAPARRLFYSERSASLAQGQKAGIIDASYDPAYLHFLLLSLATSWFSLPQLARLHIDGDPFGQEALDVYLNHLVEAVKRIIAP